MNANQFKQSLEKLGLNATQAGAALGISSGSVFLYKSGKYPVPRAIQLSLEALISRKTLDKSMYDEEEK